jgi:hypothetical protein
LNLQAVVLHQLGDAAASFFVMIIGIILKYNPEECCDKGFTEIVEAKQCVSNFGMEIDPSHQNVCTITDCTSSVNAWARYLDPISALVIMSLIAKSAVPLTRECIHILMDGKPPGLDIGRVQNGLLNIAGVTKVKRLRTWQIDSGSLKLATVRLTVTGTLTKLEQDLITKQAEAIFTSVGVKDSTVQIELPQSVHLLPSSHQQEPAGASGHSHGGVPCSHAHGAPAPAPASGGHGHAHGGVPCSHAHGASHGVPAASHAHGAPTSGQGCSHGGESDDDDQDAEDTPLVPMGSHGHGAGHGVDAQFV